MSDGGGVGADQARLADHGGPFGARPALVERGRLMGPLRWIWRLDRRTPYEMWGRALGIGVIWRVLLWVVDVPHPVALAVGIPISVVAGASFLTWFILYERDAVRGWRARRTERAR